MEVPKIIPGFSTGLARRKNPNAKAADAEFGDIRNKVLVRDKFHCMGCGISCDRVKHGLEVHHIDFNHEHNAPDNLVSLCIFCHAVMHLGFNSHGDADSNIPAACLKAVWFPEISQAELNLLSWTLGVAIFRGGKLGERASRMADIVARREFPGDWPGEAGKKVFTERILKPGGVAFFVSLLGRLRRQDAKLYAERERWFAGLRIFFDPRDGEFQKMGHIAMYSESGTWSPGKDWEGTWRVIAESFQKLGGGE